MGRERLPRGAYICTQVLFAQLFPGASKSLTAMCDRLVLDSSERDDRHGALLDADMTAERSAAGAPAQARRERRAEIMDRHLTGAFRRRFVLPAICP